MEMGAAIINLHFISDAFSYIIFISVRKKVRQYVPGSVPEIPAPDL